MKAYTKNEQVHQSNEQFVTLGERVAYEPPELTVMGRVEHLTAVHRRGPRDLLGHGNLL